LRANVPAGDTASERRLATLFVDAGAPGQAIAVLRAASASAPDDVDLLSQLADVEADAGQPADARATLRPARAAAPARGDLQTRLEVIDRVLALHPGLPSLRLTARTRRSRDLLAAVVAQTAMCDEMSGEVSDSRRDAQARLGRRAVQTAETAEADQA